MPFPFIVEIKSAHCGDIQGSDAMYGRKNIILSYRFEHKVSVNPDQEQGASIDVRHHHPLTIYKETDLSSPILAQHLTIVALLPQVVLRFFKKDARGREVNYHSIHLENALITDISPEIRPVYLKDNEPFRHMESVSFSYQSIRWVDELESREAADTTRLFDDPQSGLTVSGAAKALSPKVPEDLNVMFIDQDTFEIVVGIKARVLYPDGRYRDMMSARTGDIRLRDVDKGAYTLEGFTDQPACAHRGNTFALVTVKNPGAGESQRFKPASRSSSKSRHYSSHNHLCAIREHTVTNGELFSDVARSNGFTFEQLAYFNWGVRDRSLFPQQQKMRFECGDLSPSCDEYILKSGTIYIPEPVHATGLPTGMGHVAYVQKPGVRDVTLCVKTSNGNPVPHVTATLTLADETRYTTLTDTDGKGSFTGVPADLEGCVTYDDEEELLGRHYAADIRAAAQTPDLDRMLLYLQSAVDFSAVKKMYRQSYGTDPGKDILNAFNGDEDGDVIELFLAKTGLITQPSFAFHGEGGRT